MSVSIQTVAEDEADIRLDRWFRRHFPHITQAAMQKLCRTGQVRVDGGRVEGSTRLLPGQAVRVPPLPAGPAPKPVPVVDERVVRELERMVVYRDDHVIVLDKPWGLPVQGGPGITHHLDGMLDGLRGGDGGRPKLVHRLDRDTSGVLILARGAAAAAKLAAAFRTRHVRKTYWAVVHGRPTPQEGRVDMPLIRLGSGPGALTSAAERDDEDAASALTDYRTLEAAGRKLAWLELQPLTGRTHQLRVHCEALGTPIVGDPKYGPQEEDKKLHVEGLAMKLHLHARSLSVPHPAGGTLDVAAPLPPHMRDSFRLLGFTAPATPEPRLHRGRTEPREG